ETWNLMKIGFQMKQVRERIAKGLVDKGVLRTEKRNFVLFDMATHPLADPAAKERVVRRAVDALLGRGPNAAASASPSSASASAGSLSASSPTSSSSAPTPDRRTVALACAAYAANVLENALASLSHAQREQAFVRVDELLQEFAGLSDRARAVGATEIMAGVFSVYTK
ncbi:hypothetical protein HK405_002124, partial [Cladochytrium tenue]